jgi:hypothetical protein
MHPLSVTREAEEYGMFIDDYSLTDAESEALEMELEAERQAEYADAWATYISEDGE